MTLLFLHSPQVHRRHFVVARSLLFVLPSGGCDVAFRGEWREDERSGLWCHYIKPLR